MQDSWDRRIARADELAGGGAAAHLITFYARVLRAQKHVYESLGRTRRPSGTLATDVPLVQAAAATLVRVVAAHGPAQLSSEAQTLERSESLSALLLTHWSRPSDREFFAKAILQPYAQWVVDRGLTPDRRPSAAVENRCPKCGGMPQLSILESSGATAGDGSGRRLLCAMCLTAWPFRRIMCPWCGEDDERKLGYFESPELDYQRVEACETCRHYLKRIDLDRQGRAIPLVDEIAGAPLDLWARERGYEKVELNLLGL